jgi:hypothetical protein
VLCCKLLRRYMGPLYRIPNIGTYAVGLLIS